MTSVRQCKATGVAADQAEDRAEGRAEDLAADRAADGAAAGGSVDAAAGAGSRPADVNEVKDGADWPSVELRIRSRLVPSPPFSFKRNANRQLMNIRRNFE